MKVKYVTPAQIETWIKGLNEDELNRHIVVVLADTPDELRFLEELVATCHENNFMR